MNCRECRADTKVVDSRVCEANDGSQYIRRRRRCVSCGLRTSTVEVDLRGGASGNRAVTANANALSTAWIADELHALQGRIDAMLAALTPTVPNRSEGIT